MELFQRNKYVRFLSQLLQRLLTLPLYVLGILIPKSKYIWVFGNTFGYKDNPKYLYEYQLKDPVVRAVWISKERIPKAIQGEWHYYFSLKGIWIQYRAGIACIGTGGGDVAGFTMARTFIVQLWHGIPIKKLLLNSPEISPFSKRFLLLDKLYYWYLRRHLQKYDLITAVNEHNRQCLSEAFGLSKDRIVVTGLPRHDVILQGCEKNNIKKQRLLYAPTWRPSIREAERCVRRVLSPRCLKYFCEKKIDVNVSIHPLNSELIQLVEAMVGVEPYQGPDINVDLSSYDLLMTDYSSIAIDFSLLKRPVIFMCDDVDQYAKERGIYEYFLEIIRSDHVETEDDLIAKIELTLSSDSYNHKNLYDIHADGNARKRIVDEIKRKI